MIGKETGILNKPRIRVIKKVKMIIERRKEEGSPEEENIALWKCIEIATRALIRSAEDKSGYNIVSGQNYNVTLPIEEVSQEDYEWAKEENENALKMIQWLENKI